MIDAPAIAAAVGYLFGSIPFGLIFARLIAGRDPRTIGSGNIGATNALRAGGRGVGALTLVADVGKGALAVALSDGEAARAAAALGAFAGHLFPIWLRFRGGKGVATMFGVLIPWQPIVGALGFAVWLFALWLRRYVSVASISAAWSLPVFAWTLDGTPLLVGTLIAIAALTTWRHRDNLRRLAAGEEPTIGEDRAARERELRRG